MPQKRSSSTGVSGVKKSRNASLKRRRRSSSLDEVSKKDLEKLVARPDIKFAVNKGYIVIVGAQDGKIRSLQKEPNGVYDIKKPRRKPLVPGVVEKAPGSPTMDGLRGVENPPREIRTFDTEPAPPKQPQPKKKRFWSK